MTIYRNYRPSGLPIDALHDSNGNEIYGTGGIVPDAEINVPDDQEAQILANIEDEMMGRPISEPVPDRALQAAITALSQPQ